MPAYLGLDISARQATYAITSDGEDYSRGTITLKQLPDLLHDNQVTQCACEYTGRLGEQWSLSANELGIDAYFIHTVERRAMNRLTGASVKTDPRDALSISHMLYLWADPERQRMLRLAGHLFINAALVRNAWQLRSMVASVDQLTTQRMSAKLRILSAGRAGNYGVAELWREIADSKAPEKALDAAEAFAAAEFGPQLQLLLTIPRIGMRTATYLLAQLMPIERFDERQGSRDRSARNIKRYTGMYPRLAQSGEVIEHTRMCKSGNRRIRGMVFVAAMGEVEADSIVGRYYRQKVEGGMPKKKAIVAASIKLLGIARAVLVTGKPYHDPMAQAVQEPRTAAPEPMPDSCITQAEAARRIGMSRQRVGQLVAAGSLVAWSWRKTRIVTVESVEQYQRGRSAPVEEENELDQAAVVPQSDGSRGVCECGDPDCISGQGAANIIEQPQEVAA